MFNLTEQEIEVATNEVLTHFGKLVLAVKGTQHNPRPIIGALTITIHTNGNYDLGYVGQLQKAVVLGSLEEMKLQFYGMVTSASFQNELEALAESFSIPDSKKN